MFAGIGDALIWSVLTTVLDTERLALATSSVCDAFGLLTELIVVSLLLFMLTGLPSSATFGTVSSEAVNR